MDSFRNRIIIAVVSGVLVIAATVSIIIIKNNSGSGKEKPAKNTEAQNFGETEETTVTPAARDVKGVITGVVEMIDTEAKTILVKEVESGEKQAFLLNDTTVYKDKYDTPVTAGHFKIGDIVDVEYAEAKKLVGIYSCKRAFEYKNVRNLIIDRDIRRMDVSGTYYRYPEYVSVIGKRIFSDVSELEKDDVVHLRGIDNIVYAVIISSGHGYLTLDSEQDFVGGTIYIGPSRTEIIEAGMRLSLHQGEYDIKIENGDLQGTKTIKIESGRTAVFPASEFAAKPVATGRITFALVPDDAVLYVDGVETEYDGPVVLPYGEHEIMAVLGGYNTYHGTVNVSKTDERVDISLAVSGTLLEDDIWPDDDDGGWDYDGTWDDDPWDDDPDDDSWDDDSDDEYWGDDSDEDDPDWDPDVEWDPDDSYDDDDYYSYDDDSEDNSDDPLFTDDYDDGSESPDEDSDDYEGEDDLLIISCTDGTDVYIDGEYKGTISGGSLAIKKVYGNLMLVLKKDGCATKTYRIDVENNRTNESFSFPDMVPEG